MPTKMQCKVAIKNNASFDIKNVYVVHKYSDNYKEKLNFSSVPSGSQSNYHNTPVEFNVGFGTTGKDWWYISFETSNGLYHSNPNNFRAVFDFFDDAINLTAKIAGKVDKKAAIAGAIATELFNTEKTSGFKQHILRSEDTRCTINIYNHGKIVISSKSGDSETVYTKMDISKYE